jgi:hypothetical protein
MPGFRYCPQYQCTIRPGPIGPTPGPNPGNERENMKINNENNSNNSHWYLILSNFTLFRTTKA